MNIEEIKDFVYEVRTFGITSNDTKFVQITEYLLSELEKEKKKNKKIEKELEKHIKFCEQEAEGSLNNEICHISLNFNKKLLNILNGEE